MTTGWINDIMVRHFLLNSWSSNPQGGFGLLVDPESRGHETNDGNSIQADDMGRSSRENDDDSTLQSTSISDCKRRMLGHVLLFQPPLLWVAHLNLFWIGAALAFSASTMDLVEAWRERDEQYDDDGPMEGGPFQYWDAYKVLMVSSTLLYLIDSILHIVEERQEGADTRDMDADAASDDSSEEGEAEDDIGRKTRMQFAAIFGVAALFDLTCSVTDDEDYPWPSYIFECLSVYLFWVSAVLLLYTKRMVYCGKLSPCRNGSSPSSTFWLLCLGDWLYCLGCTTDVVVSFVDNPGHDINYLWLASGSMLSSLFWFLDAMLYQMANADMFDVIVPNDVQSPSGDSHGTMMPTILRAQNEDEAEDDELEMDYPRYSTVPVLNSFANGAGYNKGEDDT